MSYDIHSVAFGEQWAEIVFTDRDEADDDQILVRTIMLNPEHYRPELDELKTSIETLLNEAAARKREERRRPSQEKAEEPVRYITGAEFQAAVQKAMEDLHDEQLELDL